jgi:F0F1-type ATP synthase assembly protein I
VQVVVVITVALLSFMAGGRAAALSALGGAAVAWVTTLYASCRASVPERTAGAALQRVMIGEFIKVLSTIALFAAASRVPHVVWPALLGGYVAVLAAFWLSFVTAGGGQDTDGTRAP